MNKVSIISIGVLLFSLVGEAGKLLVFPLDPPAISNCDKKLGRINDHKVLLFGENIDPVSPADPVSPEEKPQIEKLESEQSRLEKLDPTEERRQIESIKAEFANLGGGRILDYLLKSMGIRDELLPYALIHEKGSVKKLMEDILKRDGSLALYLDHVLKEMGLDGHVTMFLPDQGAPLLADFNLKNPQIYKVEDVVKLLGAYPATENKLALFSGLISLGSNLEIVTQTPNGERVETAVRRGKMSFILQDPMAKGLSYSIVFENAAGKFFRVNWEDIIFISIEDSNKNPEIDLTAEYNKLDLRSAVIRKSDSRRETAPNI